MAILGNFTFKNKLLLGFVPLILAGAFLPAFVMAAPEIIGITPSPIPVPNASTPYSGTLTINGTGFTQDSKVYIIYTTRPNRDMTPAVTRINPTGTQIDLGVGVGGQWYNDSSYDLAVCNSSASACTCSLIPALSLSGRACRTSGLTTGAADWSDTFNVRVAVQDSVTEVLRTIADTITNPLTLVFAFVLYILKFINQLLFMSASGFYMLLDEGIRLMTRPERGWAVITNNDVFKQAWSLLKDYANMLIVLELIATAVMMILNLWKENARKILGSIIIVALLVNFSPIVFGVLVDGSNIVMRELLDRDGFNNLNVVQRVSRAYNNSGLNGLVSPNIAGDVIKASRYGLMVSLFSVIYFIMVFVFIYLIIVLLQRYIYLAFLFIVSPLAFACWPFPPLHQWWSKWWHSLLQNCFMGISVMFFLRLAGQMVSSRLVTEEIDNFIRQAPSLANILDLQVNFGQQLSSMFSILLIFSIVFGILFFGVKSAAKTAGPIADALMKAVAAIAVIVVEAVVTGGASLASGAGFAAASKAAGGQLVKSVTEGGGGILKTGLSKTAEGLTGSDAFGKAFGQSKVIKEGISEGFTKLGEKAGLVPEGASAGIDKKKQQEKVKPYLDNYQNISDNLKLSAMATDENESEESRAAAAEILRQRGKLHLIESGRHKDLALNAKKFGFSTREYIMESPDLATDEDVNGKEIDEIMASGLAKNKKEAKKIALRRAAASANRKFATEASETDIIKRVNKALAKQRRGEELDFEDVAFIQEAGKQELLSKTKAKSAEDKDALFKHTDYYGYNARRLEEKKDFRMDAYSEETQKKVESIENDGRLTRAQKDENIERIRYEAAKTAANKLTGDKLADLPKAVQEEAAKLIDDPAVLARAILRASPEGKQAIAKGMLKGFEHLNFEKLAAIPEEIAGDVLDEVEKEIPDIRQKIKDRFEKYDTISAEQGDVEGAERAKIKDIEDLRAGGFIPTGLRPQDLMGDTPLEKSRYEAAIIARKASIVPKTDRAEMIKHIDELRKEGFMRTEEEIEENEKNGISMDLEEYYQHAVDAKRDSIKPIEVPSRGDLVSTEEGYVKPDLETQWKKLAAKTDDDSKRKKARIGQVFEELNKPPTP